MLEVAGLAKRYPAAAGGAVLQALGGVDLRVEPEEIVALLGPSGCGKSTLLRLLSGLERPSAGSVEVDGRAVTGPTPEIAMVFQEPRLMPWLGVAENVRLALLDLPRAEQDRRIAAVLERVGLAGFAAALPRQLSGGMAQRVAIARALAREPEILLLDEPFSALDTFTRQRLQEHLLELWQSQRLTMLLVTHDIEEALALSDRVLAMRGGPGRLHAEFRVDLPRPRRRAAAAFQAVKERVVAALDLS